MAGLDRPSCGAVSLRDARWNCVGDPAEALLLLELDSSLNELSMGAEADSQLRMSIFHLQLVVYRGMFDMVDWPINNV